MSDNSNAGGSRGPIYIPPPSAPPSGGSREEDQSESRSNSNSVRVAWSNSPSIAETTDSNVTYVPETRLVPPGSSKAPPPKPPERKDKGKAVAPLLIAPPKGYSPAPSVALSIQSYASSKGKPEEKPKSKAASIPNPVHNRAPKERDLLCANVTCEFLLHTDPSQSWTFCCAFCEGRHFCHAWALNKAALHQWCCECREPPADAPLPKRALPMHTPRPEWDLPKDMFKKDQKPFVPAQAPSVGSCSECGDSIVLHSDSGKSEDKGPPPPPAPLLVGSEVVLTGVSGDIKHLEGHTATILTCCERCDPLYHLKFPLDGGEVCGIHEDNLQPTKSPYLVSRPAEGCARLCNFCLLCNAWAGANHLEAKRHISRAYTPWKFILQRDIPRQGRLQPVTVQKGGKAIRYKAPAPGPPTIKEEKEENGKEEGEEDDGKDDGSEASNGSGRAKPPPPAPPVAVSIKGWQVPTAPSQTPSQTGVVGPSGTFQKYAWTGDDSQASDVQRPAPPPPMHTPWADVVLPPDSGGLWAGGSGSVASSTSSIGPPLRRPPGREEVAGSEISDHSVTSSLREFLQVEETLESSGPPPPPPKLATRKAEFPTPKPVKLFKQSPPPQVSAKSAKSKAIPQPPQLNMVNGSPSNSQSSKANVLTADQVREAQAPSAGSSKSSVAASVVVGAAFSVNASDVLTGCIPQTSAGASSSFENDGHTMGAQEAIYMEPVPYDPALITSILPGSQAGTGDQHPVPTVGNGESKKSKSNKMSR
eukprot:gnl/MRDRNA2_/MRDRNA2_114719_c0_seq1.p1 gnl/MRDRNA2_/MRDRNA2_114719_c0~~gnl/MRDRNA2_/MRDRNA2_114719_c0_seq1.p1  ORF type:complete len:758 (-),score=148.05 gnl/MRDRNA2_/MRDRNA2_114719_c0_seq1:82-2355(-)